MKEQVIVFEGEHLFVAPKKRISNKKKGIQVSVPDNVDVVGVDKSVISPIVELPKQPDAPKEPDEPIRIITPPSSGSADISVKTFGGGSGGGTISTKPLGNPVTTMGTLPPSIGEPNIGLGNPTKQFPSAGEEITTSTTTSTTTQAPTQTSTNIGLGVVPLVPLSFGSAPRMGGGGGGGGEEEAPVEKKKTNYLWLILLGIAGLIYFTKKKS
jgi:hypothetical protein